MSSARQSRAALSVVCNFIVQALKNEPITLYGDGQQTRSPLNSARCRRQYIDEFIADRKAERQRVPS